MMDWKTAILRTIQSIGGIVSNKQLYDNINKFKSLTSHQSRETEWGDRPAFQHTIRTYLSNLVKKGLIEKVSRGRHQLTEKTDKLLISTSKPNFEDINHKKLKGETNVYWELEDEQAIEGYTVDSQFNRIVRNKSITKKRKQLDDFTCKICGFRLNLNNKYVIECHHLSPLSKKRTTITKLDDLISICPTCHRIAHMRTPPYTIKELIYIIKQSKSREQGY